jgi:hypothetical protein
MSESIGNLYTTRVPELSDTADIQEALRLYHYGKPSGGNTAAGEYPISNSERSLLEPNSVAGWLNNLQNQISGFQSGILPSAYTQKGVIIIGRQPGVPEALLPDSNGQVLTLNSGSTLGVRWDSPEVTKDNDAYLTNKRIGSTGLRFPQSDAENSFAITLILPTTELTANRTVQFPPTAAMPNPTTTLVGRDTIDVLTNKSLSVDQITGILPLSKGGTGLSNSAQPYTAASARANLEIFNSQSLTSGPRTTYSGKIYVVPPSVAGVNGTNLIGATTGDLWFW